jgi:hypothetical protein
MRDFLEEQVFIALAKSSAAVEALTSRLFQQATENVRAENDSDLKTALNEISSSSARVSKVLVPLFVKLFPQREDTLKLYRASLENSFLSGAPIEKLLEEAALPTVCYQNVDATAKRSNTAAKDLVPENAMEALADQLLRAAIILRDDLGQFERLFGEDIGMKQFAKLVGPKFLASKNYHSQFGRFAAGKESGPGSEVSRSARLFCSLN